MLKRPNWLLSGALALAVGSVLIALYAFRGQPGDDLAGGARTASAPAPGKSALAGGGQAGEIEARIASAGRRDFASLFLAALEIGNPAERHRILALLVQRWMAVDLKEFVAFVDAMEVNEAVPGGIWAVLAPVLAEVLPKLDERTVKAPMIREIIRRLVSYWCETDPNMALAWANKYLNGDALDSALAGVVPALARESVPQAQAVFGTIKLAVRRVEAIDALGHVLGRKSAEEAIAWAGALENPAERPYAMGSVLAAMPETEPVAASKEFSRYRQQMNSEYAAEYARDRALAPANPAELVEGNLEPGQAPIVPANPQLHLLNDAAVAITENWAKTDAAGAVSWVNGFNEGKMKYDAMGSVLAGWSGVDGAGAYEYYAPFASAQPALAEPLFREWALNDPGAASKQAALIGDATAQQNAVSGVINGWMARGADFEQLEKWVDTLRDPAARDMANAELVAAVSLEKPIEAWQRALQIQGKEPRADAMQTSFASLVEKDLGEAGHALASARLPEAELETLQLMLEAAGGRLQ